MFPNLHSFLEKINAKQQKLYNDLCIIAKFKGGRIMSEAYINAKTPIHVECSEKHQWDTTPNILKNDSWCVICFREKPHKKLYDDLCEIAQSKGGRIVSESYTHSRIPIRVECFFKHQWDVKPNGLKNGTWCPVCVNRNPDASEQDLIQIVANKGGKLIGKYVNIRTKLEIECRRKHRWMANLQHVKSSDSWCPICASGTEEAEKRFYQMVADKGGKVHREYTNNHDRVEIEIECRKEHRWQIIPKDLFRGTWCRICSFKMDIVEQEFRDAVKSKGGIVLGEYINGSGNVLVQCEARHQWNGNVSWIRRGTWCQQCNQSRGGREVSDTLKKLGIQFSAECRHPLLPSRKYDFYFMYNGVHYLLEFDGIQHFELNSLFHSDQEDFNIKQDIDKLKTYVALATGYCMIKIDYTQIGKVYDCLIQALQFPTQLYVSSIQMYSWLLGSIIPVNIIEKYCPALLTI